jgi:hypothetical protein
MIQKSFENKLPEFGTTIQFQNQGLVLLAKILRSEKFSEKVRKFKTYHFVRKVRKII